MSGQRQTRLMAILNLTPDSFSDGGQFHNSNGSIADDQVLKKIEQFLADGFNPAIDILDIGGESTRPGAIEISAEEECTRILPIVTLVRQHFPEIKISLDTRKAQVAKAALDAGASIINDVSGLQFDPSMASIIAEAGCPLVLMHSVGTPQTMQALAHEENLYPNGIIQEIIDFFNQQFEFAIGKGIPTENIILDPGFGFGKTREQQFHLLRNLKTIREAFPNQLFLIGTSRKSFLSLVNPTADKDQLTALTTYEAVLHHDVDIVRVHNIASQLPAIYFAEALKEETNDTRNFANDYSMPAISGCSQGD